jgi:16S rRNA (uracil1498-N3)-methyltransferase
MINMQYYFSDDIHENLSIVLSEDEHIHCTKVLRHRIGDTLHVLDGKGNMYITAIAEIKKQETLLSIKEIITVSKKVNPVYVAISPTKNPSRTEWFIEKATEIGVSGIYFIICDRTENKFLKTDRWKKIIISAAKQSGQVFFPSMEIIDPLYSLSKINELSICKKYIAHCQMEENHLLTVVDASKPQLVLIGPEGDFTQAEIEWAIQNHFNPVSLGKSRLRTETAGLYALFCLNASTI